MLTRLGVYLGVCRERMIHLALEFYSSQGVHNPIAQDLELQNAQIVGSPASRE